MLEQPTKTRLPRRGYCTADARAESFVLVTNRFQRREKAFVFRSWSFVHRSKESDLRAKDFVLGSKYFGLRASGSPARANRFELRIERFRALRVEAKKGASEFWMSLFPVVSGESASVKV